MGTTRTPKRHIAKMRITPLAIFTFRQMQALEPHCPTLSRHIRGCAVCERWWELHSTLWEELAIAVWEWPAIEKPPEGYEGGPPETDAMSRYQALDAAARADLAETPVSHPAPAPA
jgi:hypothetical protein